MTHPLASLRELLLDHDHPDKLLTVADGYLNSMTRMGASFILPAEHRMLLPILEYYAGDLPGWVKYVKGIRDRLDKGDERWRGIYDLYRTLEIRSTQRERRDRLNAAVDMAVKKRIITDEVESKRRYANRCTQEWMKRRTALLNSVRGRTKGGRINEDERSQVLDEFWTDIDQQIAAGEVPEP